MLLLVFAGCASTNPQAAFNDVNQTVATRAGQAIQWPRGTVATNETANAVAALLETNLTASSAAAIALLNNRSLQAEFEEIGISQAELAQASRPANLEFFGNWRIPNRPPSAVDMEDSLTADFLDLLTLPARKKIAARNLGQTKLEVADKVLQLAAETQTAFYDLQAQLELVKRLDIIVEVNDASADVAQRQYDAGNINELTLHEQQAPAAQSRLDWMSAKAEAQRLREHLNRLLGLSGEQIRWQITDELPSIPERDISLENLESLAINQRLDLAAQKDQMESIAAALKLKKHTRYIPGAAIGVDTERTPDGQRVTGPTLDLELPIFDQGQPAIAKLTAELQQAQDNYTAQEFNIRSEVREAQAAMLAAREAAEFSKKNLLPLRKQILGETLLQYNAMQKNSFDLLVAKEREQRSEQSSVEASRDYWIARVQLERAVGGRLAIQTNAPAMKTDSVPMPQEHQHEK